MLEEIEDWRLREMLRRFPDRAINHLFVKYRRRMTALARYITLDPLFTEDIVQDTFLYLLQNHKQISKYHDLPLERYIIRIVKFKSITYVKTTQFNEQRLRKYYHYGYELSETSPEAQLIEKEIGDEIRAIIGLLTKRERECLLMRIEDGMDVDLIARRLKITVKGVERNITAAKKRLRRLWLSRNRPISWIF